jgi:hypothetical protein
MIGVEPSDRVRAQEYRQGGFPLTGNSGNRNATSSPLCHTSTNSERGTGEPWLRSSPGELRQPSADSLQGSQGGRYDRPFRLGDLAHPCPRNALAGVHWPGKSYCPKRMRWAYGIVSSGVGARCSPGGLVCQASRKRGQLRGQLLAIDCNLPLVSITYLIHSVAASPTISSSLSSSGVQLYPKISKICCKSAFAAPALLTVVRRIVGWERRAAHERQCHSCRNANPGDQGGCYDWSWLPSCG